MCVVAVLLNCELLTLRLTPMRENLPKPPKTTSNRHMPPMTSNQRRHWSEQSRFLFGSESFQNWSYVTINLSNRAGIETFITRFYLRLARISKCHLVCSTGYCDFIGRRPHFHSIISSTKPLSAVLVMKAIEPQRSKVSKRPSPVDFRPFEPNDEGRGWRYTNVKHKTFTTSLFHPLSRCNNQRCRFYREIEASNLAL